MEKGLKNDFIFKIVVNNEDLLMASADNGSFAVTAEYDKNYCRRHGITCYHYTFYGNDEINDSLLLNTLNNWVVDTQKDKF